MLVGKPTKVRTVISLIKSMVKKGTPLFGKAKMRKDETLVHIQEFQNNEKF